MTYKNGRLGGKMLNEVEQICVDCIYHETDNESRVKDN